MIIGQPENQAPLVIMASGKEVLRIERDHTVLHGQRVDDAGEAHRALIGALTGLAPTWKPIETAPRDGTRIVVWDGEQAECAAWVKPLDAWIGDWGLSVRPTHWVLVP